MIGAVDAGSNAIRFSIFRLNEKLEPAVCSRKRYAVRLGAGTFHSGSLADADMDAAAAAFGEIARIANEQSLVALRAVATSAVREADNAGAFLARIKNETGIELAMITGKEEIRLAALGAISGAESGNGFIVIDVGGGSSEVALIDDSRKVQWDVSLPLGAVRLARQWSENDRADVNTLRSGLVKTVRSALTESGLSSNCSRAKAFALGGTAGALSGVAGRLGCAMFENTLTAGNLDFLLKQLSGVSVSEMPTAFHVDPSRAPLMVPGSMILWAIVNALQVRAVVVSDAGVREGLVLDYLDSFGTYGC